MRPVSLHRRVLGLLGWSESPISSRAQRLLVAFGALLVAAILAISAVAIWQLRERALTDAQREITNLNRVLAEHTARSVQSVDLILRSTLEWVRGLSGRQRAAGDRALHEALRNRIEGVPQVAAISLVGPDGHIIATSRSWPPPDIDVSDVPYFRAHTGLERAGLHVDPRVALSDGRWTLFFTRRIDGPGGEFQGIAVAHVDPEFFEAFYREIDLGEGAAVSLLRSDGVLLARHPKRDEWLGRSFAHGGAYRKILSPGGGAVLTTGVVDGVPRIIAGERLTDLPLAVNVSMTESAALGQWRRWTATILATAAFTTAAVIWLIGQLLRQISGQEALRAVLRRSETRLREAQQVGHVGSWAWDPATRRHEWSDETCGIFGVDAGTEPGYTRFLECVHPEDRRALDDLLREASRGGHSYETECRVLRPDGEERWVQIVSQPLLDASGRITRIEGTVADVTAQRRAEERLKLGASVFERTREANFVTDAANRIVSVNRAFADITGYAEAEVLGRDPRFLSSGRHPAAFYRDMWDSLRETGHWEGEIWNRRKDGEVYPAWLSIEGVPDARDGPARHIAILSDITERKRAEERIHSLAYFDALTGLPNRALLRDRVEQALAAAHRHQGSLALLFLDIDRFKFINDSLGHQVGDLTLRGVAERIKSCLREVDTVARVGGDEFVVLLPGTDGEGAARVARKVLERMAAPLIAGGHELACMPSIGIACFPGDGRDAEALLKCADTAMYHAKASGRGRYQFFTPDMSARAAEALALEVSLRHALAREEFFLLYQPLIRLGDGGVACIEALLRWRHPEKGVIEPADFVPLAEALGLMAPVGEWVLREACREARRRTDAGAGGIRVAVNVSGAQFRQNGLLQVVREIVTDAGIDPCLLELEVTESMLMGSGDDRILAQLVGLRDLGVHFVIDDFGIGYSSLGYMRRLPVEKLKIDQSFVRGLPANAEDAAIVGAVLGLAKSLGLRVTAEGVETREQLDWLADRGCDEAQGFLLAPPMTGDGLLQRLADANGTPPFADFGKPKCANAVAVGVSEPP